MASLTEILGGESTPYKLMQQQIMSSIRVAMPGIVVSFDAGSQTASVKPAVNDSIIEGGKQKSVPLPVISDVPVAFPQGGDYAVTLPVKDGDACILIFADSCIDAFAQSGTESAQAEVRHHDLSDAIAIVGISTGNAPVPGYDPDNLEMRHKDKPIKITLSDAALDLRFEGSTINMTAARIKLTSGVVDVNGTLF